MTARIHRAGAFALGALLFTFLAFLASDLRAQEAQRVGEVESLEGEALALAAGSERALAAGAPLHKGERVRCAEGGTLRILLLDGSRLVVAGGSEIRLDRYQVDAWGRRSEGLFTLLRGVLRAVAEASPLEGSFDLQSRAAVASARSTDWIVEETGEKSAVFVVEGAVTVRGAAGGNVILREGQGVDVPHGEPLGEVKEWGQGRVDALLARTSLR